MIQLAERSAIATGPLVVGAGPAGLTAARELVALGFEPLVLEQLDQVGGIARTVQFEGYRFDLGGHRFFTKSAEVKRVWEEILGEDMLECSRLSRIFYKGSFFHYPLKPANALLSLGPVETVRIGLSYLWVKARPRRPETSFEDWVTNRFGRRLFEIFFKTYTEKVWGMPCSEIGADWASQRIKNLDLATAIRKALLPRAKADGEVVTTLIDRFHYPRLGPGMMWERCAEQIAERGARTVLGARVQHLHHDGRAIVAVDVEESDGRRVSYEPEHVLSSMPVRSLIRQLRPRPPAEVRAAAERLGYRDFLTVVLIVDREDLFPDNWIYVHEPGVRLGRIQNFKNWSAEMVPHPKRTALGLEYFVNRGDDLWELPDDELGALGARETAQLGLIDERDVVATRVVRVPKAYPVYDRHYRAALDTIRAWLSRLENLQLIGRNGQHRYNNQDHSMLTGILAARNIAGASYDVWDVNTEQEYHEEGSVSSRSGDRAAPLLAG